MRQLRSDSKPEWWKAYEAKVHIAKLGHLTSTLCQAQNSLYNEVKITNDVAIVTCKKCLTTLGRLDAAQGRKIKEGSV